MGPHTGHAMQCRMRIEEEMHKNTGEGKSRVEIADTRKERHKESKTDDKNEETKTDDKAKTDKTTKRIEQEELEKKHTNLVLADPEAAAPESERPVGMPSSSHQAARFDVGTIENHEDKDMEAKDGKVARRDDDGNPVMSEDGRIILAACV